MTHTPSNQRENTGLWLLKVIAGVLILAVLGIHFVVNHLVAPEGLLSYADVVQYYQNPAVVGMEIAFLVIVVAHALLGLRSILLDLHPPEKVMQWVNWALVILGAAAVVYGVWLALEIAGRGV